MIKNNRLIAEFIGLRWETKPNYTGWYKGEQRIASDETLKYDSSWDWLIPVVKKCKETDQLVYNGSNIKTALLTLDIDELYFAVIEFIEYHNDVTNRPFIPNLEYKDGFGNWYDYTEELQKNKSFNPFKTRVKNK